MGSAVAVCTSATMSGDPAMDVINHAAATDWMRPPRFDSRLAIQTLRKIAIPKGVAAASDCFAGLCVCAVNQDQARHLPWMRYQTYGGSRRPGGFASPFNVVDALAPGDPVHSHATA